MTEQPKDVRPVYPEWHEDDSKTVRAGDGGQPSGKGGDVNVSFIPGLTMRDYFALHYRPPTEAELEALQKREHELVMSGRGKRMTHQGRGELEATWRYVKADHMLQERNND